MKNWVQTSKELLLRTRLFEISRVGFRSPATGKENHFDVVASPDWVNVVPFLADGRVLLVEQFRFGVGECTLEFPAGKVEAGQTPEEAASRELKEETGGEGSGLELVGRCFGNPAFLNNYCYHFVAYGVELKNPPSPDDHEEVEYRAVSPADVDTLIADGSIRHPLAIASWYFYRNGRQNP